MCCLITSARGFKLGGCFVVGVVRCICCPGRARSGGRGDRIAGACHSVAREAAPTVASIRRDSASRSVGRPVPSARGFELVGGFGVGVVRRTASVFPLAGGFVVGGARRIQFPGRARCGGRGNRIMGARLPPLHPVTGEAVKVAP